MYLLVISRFSRKVDFIKVGSWSIIVISFLRSLSGNYPILLPSTKISPPTISVTLNRVLIIVVLPAPVRPTIPTFYPFFIVQFKLFKTIGRSFLYLTQVYLN